MPVASLIKSVKPTEVTRSDKRHEHANEAHDRQICRLLPSPAGYETIVDQQQVHEPSEKGKEDLGVPCPKAPHRLGPQGSRYDSERDQRKTDGKSLVGK